MRGMPYARGAEALRSSVPQAGIDRYRPDGPFAVQICERISCAKDQMIRARTAQMAACTRLDTPILVKIIETCRFTVVGLR